MLYLYTFHLIFLAPSGPPINITISADTTTIHLEWLPPILQDRNDVITSYDITYTGNPLDTGTVYTNQTMLSGQESAVILYVSGLEEFNYYTFNITAVNAGGVGVVALVATQTTLSDGKSNLLLEEPLQLR